MVDDRLASGKRGVCEIGEIARGYAAKLLLLILRANKISNFGEQSDILIEICIYIE